ncbi:MAG TPA: glycosyltransferase family 2 protein [Chitinophagaceae bacterium]|nr:glycosyltransferase family 2 protein [Chitinophagaceae bacterium]
MKTYIIIPAFNESSRIAAVLESLLSLNYSMIVIDDGSADDTAKIAATFPVILIRHELNLGQGAALETGMEAARQLEADYVVHFDSDGQHVASDIEHLLAPLQKDEADIVFGSRFLEKKPSGLTFSRKIILKVGRWINYLITGILLSDAHNGLRALNNKALHAVHFRQPGMAHASEILYEVRRKSLRYLELPVHILYTDYSKQKGQGILNSVNILFHLLFKR